MAICITAIKGNHLSKASRLFEVFDYSDNHKDLYFDDWNKTNDYLYENYSRLADKNIAIRGIWFDNGWTLICDPETVDSSDAGAIEKLSELTSSEVIFFVSQTTSTTYLFGKYHPGQKRYFCCSEGKIMADLGDPLAEEKGLNISEIIFEDDIEKLAKNLGINLNPIGLQTKFCVKQLAFTQELLDKLDNFSRKGHVEEPTKPWWKIW